MIFNVFLLKLYDFVFLNSIMPNAFNFVVQWFACFTLFTIFLTCIVRKTTKTVFCLLTLYSRKLLVWIFFFFKILCGFDIFDVHHHSFLWVKPKCITKPFLFFTNHFSFVHTNNIEQELKTEKQLFLCFLSSRILFEILLKYKSAGYRNNFGREDFPESKSCERETKRKTKTIKQSPNQKKHLFIIYMIKNYLTINYRPHWPNKIYLHEVF